LVTVPTLERPAHRRGASSGSRRDRSAITHVARGPWKHASWRSASASYRHAGPVTVTARRDRAPEVPASASGLTSKARCAFRTASGGGGGRGSGLIIKEADGSPLCHATASSPERGHRFLGGVRNVHPGRWRRPGIRHRQSAYNPGRGSKGGRMNQRNRAIHESRCRGGRTHRLNRE